MTSLRKTKCRCGLSLVEVLLVIGIIAALIGLLIPAVMKARSAAIMSQSTNNMRQILTAAHNYALANGNYYPSIFGNKYQEAEDVSFFLILLPNMDQQSILDEMMKSDDGFVIKAYLDPADPTATLTPPPIRASYAANAYALRQKRTLASGFPDGTSNTAAVSTHYSRCKNVNFNITLSSTAGMGFHRATFADSEDVRPWVKPTGTTASWPGKTFQVRPLEGECVSEMPQSAYASGILIGNIDGSVKTVSESVTPETFWSFSTADGNEAVTE